MKKKRNLIPIYSFIVVGLFLLSSCSGDMLTAPAAENENQDVISTQIGIPTDQLKLVPLKPEIAEQLRTLAKDGYEEKLIIVHKGGTVGGKHTFKNKVEIPKKALSEDTWISVNVECIEAGDQCGASVDFLPNMRFQLNVTVTLSYDILDFDGDPSTLKVMWYDDVTGLWVEVENPRINKNQKTVSVKVDHFTRYSWSL